MWGVVWGSMNQITDSEADQTHNVSTYRAISGSNSFYAQRWLKVSERQIEWQTGVETPGLKSQLLPLCAM